MQTETPVQLAARNEERKKQKLPKVVMRSPILAVEHLDATNQWQLALTWTMGVVISSVIGIMPSVNLNSVHRLQASVVNRDMVAVVTRGTMTDAEMLSRHPDASFLLALAEAPAAPADSATGVQLPSPPCFRCMKYMFQ